MTIQGFGSAFSNGVMLALPLLLWLFGEPGGVPALLIITLDVIVFSSSPCCSRSAAAARRRDRLADRAQALRAVARQPDHHGHRARHPVTA